MLGLLGLRHDVHWKNFGSFNLEPGILTVIRVRLWVLEDLIGKIGIGFDFVVWEHFRNCYKM